MNYLIVHLAHQTRVQSSCPTNDCSGDNIRDDTRLLSVVNVSPLFHKVVSTVSSTRNEP
jgi:hypothetical protein